MRALFDPDLELFSDEEDIAEFRRGFAAIGEDQRRVLMILIPKLVALRERGDPAGALALIAAIRTILVKDDKPPH